MRRRRRPYQNLRKLLKDFHSHEESHLPIGESQLSERYVGGNFLKKSFEFLYKRITRGHGLRSLLAPVAPADYAANAAPTTIGVCLSFDQRSIVSAPRKNANSLIFEAYGS
jgi:hypothetical protein